MNFPKPIYRRRVAASSRVLRIECPSVAIVRDYKNHNNNLLGDGRGDLEVSSSKTPQMRATTTTSTPRRHLTVAQPSPVAIPSSISASGSDGVRRTLASSEEMDVDGKQQPSFSAELFPPSMSVSPVDSLHLPITPLPLNLPKNSNICNPLHPLNLGNIPWDYTSHRLQEWGMVYLYNNATADAFVRAVPLNLHLRSSSGLNRPPDDRRSSGSEPTVVLSPLGVGESKSGERSARQPDKVVERISSSMERASLGGGRKAKDEVGASFRVQHPGGQDGSSVVPLQDSSLSRVRDEFHKSTHRRPSPPSSVPSYMREVKVRARVIPATTGASTGPRQPMVIEKSFPVNMSQSLDHLSFSEQRSLSSPPPSSPLTAIRHREIPALPIHIEYATYRAPLLGAILVSGFVRTGDIVEVPLPWPELWEETVVGIYTGRIGIRGTSIYSKVRGNLEFLGWKEISYA